MVDTATAGLGVIVIIFRGAAPSSAAAASDDLALLRHRGGLSSICSLVRLGEPKIELSRPP